jgi:hypothetical protein
MERPEPTPELAVKLGEAMVERLQAHVPDGVQLSSHGTWVGVTAESGRSETIDFMKVLDQGPRAEDHLENAIWMILEHVQDFIVEHVLHAPWPPAGGDAPVALPVAGVKRVENGFEVFYAPGLVLANVTDEELGLT